jgi:hypothetical protein
MRWQQSMIVIQLAACGPEPQRSDTGTSSSTGLAGSTAVVPTTSATGQITGSTTEDSMSDSAGILDKPDIPMDDSCDPHAEMPCPEGQKCSASSKNSGWGIFAGGTSCFPVLGDLPKGASCDLGADPSDGLDDCAANMVCVDWTRGSNGICREFCDPVFNGLVQACSDPTEFCYAPSCQSCYLGVCIPACDPLFPNCPAGEGCFEGYYSYQNGFACGPVALDLPGVGDPCDHGYACADKARCVGSDAVASPACADSESCCTAYCDLNAPNTCPGKAMGEVCQPYFPEPFDPQTAPWGVQYNKLGYCALP